MESITSSSATNGRTVTAPPLETCPRHGLPLSRARKHFQWGGATCKSCRTLARKNAYKARRRDPHSIKLTCALYREFAGNPFMLEQASRVAIGFGVDAHRLDALLTELGPGDYDPKVKTEVNASVLGDGLLEIVDGGEGRFRIFRFDEWWLDARARRSVARGEPESAQTPPAATLSTPLQPSSDLGGAGAARATAQHAPILDRSVEGGRTPVRSRALGRRVLGHVDVARLIQRIAPDLDAAGQRGEMLLRVSLTMPPWSRTAAASAAEAFRRDMLSMGASGVLLARDYSKTGAAHWYGLLSLPPLPTPKIARALVARSWIAASGGTSACQEIVTVTAWGEFVESGGNLDAKKGRDSFRTNLTRVLRYAFKPWPPAYGERLVGDVLESGSFVGSALACTP